MQINSRQKLVRGIIWGAVFSIVATTALTIGGELYSPLKNWLTMTFSHHWLGKSILSIVVFVAVVLIASVVSKSEEDENQDDDKFTRLIWTLFVVATTATFGLVGFYLYEYFK